MKLSWLLFFFLSFTATAGEFKMAVITSEFDDNVTDFFLETNNAGFIDGLRWITTLPNGGIQEDVSVPAEKILQEGTVLVERNGYEAVRLEVENFNLENGGTIKVNYLFNGATGNRRVKRLELKRDKEHYLLTDEGKKINQLFFVANTVRLLGIVGVKEVLTRWKE